MNRSIRELLGKEFSKARAVSPEADALFYYFYNGDHHFTSPEALGAKWRELENVTLDSDRLIDLLYTTKRHLQADKFYNTYLHYTRVIASNWECWEKPMRNKLTQLSPKDLCTAVMAPASLRILPSETYLEEWFAAAGEKISTFNAQDLTNLMYASAALRKAPPEKLLQQWAERFEIQSRHFNTQDIANSLWAVAALHAKTDNPLYHALFSAMKDKRSFVGHTLPDAHQKQIHDSYLWFDEPPPVSNVNRDGTKSIAEKSMVSRLRAIGFHIDTYDHPIPVLQRAIDFRLKARGKWMSFEIDGPQHFLHSTQTNGYVSNGRTLFRTALCRKLAPNEIIVRLPFDLADDWIKNTAKRQHEIMNFITDEVLAMGAGAYKVKYVDDVMVVDPMLLETSPRMLNRAYTPSADKPAPLYA